MKIFWNLFFGLLLLANAKKLFYIFLTIAIFVMILYGFNTAHGMVLL